GVVNLSVTVQVRPSAPCEARRGFPDPLFSWISSRLLDIIRPADEPQDNGGWSGHDPDSRRRSRDRGARIHLQADGHAIARRRKSESPRRLERRRFTGQLRARRSRPRVDERPERGGSDEAPARGPPDPEAARDDEARLRIRASRGPGNRGFDLLAPRARCRTLPTIAAGSKPARRPRRWPSWHFAK